MSPQDTQAMLQATLDARARELARPLVAPVAAGAEELLSFTLARETYAVETQFVFAVFRLVDITPLPGAEPPLYGVTAWRGDVLTVLDLRTIFGSASTALDDLSRVIVLGDRRPAFGILADTLGATILVSPDDLFPIPEEGRRVHDYFRGITRDATLILDAPRLLRRQADSN
jgi:purine-binding chemotaxis protein CheW